MIRYLFDPARRRYIINEMRVWDKYPDVYTPEVCTELIKTQIIPLLQWWIYKYKSQRYDLKYSEVNHYVLPIAENFLELVNIIVDQLGQGTKPDDQMINLVDQIWTSFNEYAGFFNLSLHRQRSYEQSRKARGERKRDTFTPLIKKLARNKTSPAKELWPELYALLDNEDCVVKETGNRNRPETWAYEIEVYESDSNESITYSNFKNRLSDWRKKTTGK